MVTGPPAGARGHAAPDSLSLDELAIRADVDGEYVRRLIELGALEPIAGPEPYRPSDVRRVRLLRTWEAAGFPVQAIVDLVRAGELSASWLEWQVTTRAERLNLTYEQLCNEEDVQFALVQALEEALGFAPPDAHDRSWAGDRELVGLVRMVLAAGASQAQTLGLVRVFADSMRRVAKAEADLYESQIEGALRRAGRSERELLDYGARFGDDVIASIERALLNIYRRHREHVWIEHCITHGEVAMERAGLHQRIPKPPAICFVDLTGYTRITEERGDEVAAEVATGLMSLVEDISRRRGGWPIRWLGDGGMFHFKQPGDAVLAALDMVESAPLVGLPPVHIGIHTGPVVFQDGDVYGRTVNLASRIASHARAGEVLASEETVSRSRETNVQFEPLAPVAFKGVEAPVALHRAYRDHQG